MPTIPQNDAGWRTEPPVSEPRPAGTAPAATSAAEPPDEPPGTRVLSKGCSARPYAECSVEDPIPNSSQLVFPVISAPAALSLATAVAKLKAARSEEHTSELQSQSNLVCRLLLEKKKS